VPVPKRTEPELWVQRRSLADVLDHLRERLPAIQTAVLLTIYEVKTDVAARDADYEEGLRTTTAAVIEYSLRHLAGLSDSSIPVEAVAQVRRAVQRGVSIETVLMRYIGEFVVAETEQIGLSSHGSALRRTQEALLERLLAAIEHEYVDERERVARTSEQSRTELVRRLLAEESVESTELTELAYELHASWHVGVIVTEAGVQDAIRSAKATLGCEALVAQCGDKTAWAWLGASRALNVVDVERLLSKQIAPGVLAIGGLRQGLNGWRQTHREAKGALLRAQREPERVARYADGPLLAAALENDTLAAWLREFLLPLRDRPDRGAELLRTIRAYIDAGCNSTCAGATLDIRRQTVASRLRVVENLLGRQLGTCLAELDVALRLADLAPDDSCTVV
jgi:sugar diacid utilization regulator